MAKGKKTGGRDFQPGHKLAKGAPKLPDWVKEARRLTTEKFVDALHALCDLPTETVKQIAEDESLPVKSSIMANWLSAARHNDKDRQSLFDRLFGKVTDKVEVKMPRPTVIKRADGTEIVLGAALEESQDE